MIAENKDGQVSAQQVEEEDEGSETSSLWGKGIEEEFPSRTDGFIMILLSTKSLVNHILMAWVCDHVILTPGK